MADGKADGPGGAVLNQGTLLIQDSTPRNNQATDVNAGGALANDFDAHMTIENSVIEDNQATDAGAIYTRGVLTITASTLRDNMAHNILNGNFGGGAILQEMAENAHTFIADSLIVDNQAGTGAPGGGVGLLTGSLRIENSTLERNVGSASGGALHIAAGASAEVLRSRLIDNRTLPADSANNFLGGAIYNHGVLLVEDGTLSGNQATDGGALFSGGAGSQLTLRRSTVSGNTASGGHPCPSSGF